MIRLEQVIEILKKDNNFREISSAGEYYFNWPKEVNFDQLSYDSRKSTENTLFFAKGLNFKKEYLTDLEAAFYVSEFDYEVALPAIIFSNPRMFAEYGRQKGWEREIPATDTDNPPEKSMDGFVEVTEQMELPF